MASVDSWSDFEAIRHTVKNNTVDRLKQILLGFNDECGTRHSRTGKKQEIIDRILTSLDNWRATGAEELWLKAKAIVTNVKLHGTYTPPQQQPMGSVNPSSNTLSHIYHANNIPKPAYHSSLPSTSSVLPPFNPYAPARRPTVSTTPSTAPSTTTAYRKSQPICFKESPFYKVDQLIGSIVECPESVSSSDRRQQHVTYRLSSDQISKLSLPNPKYQLRLFCTSSIFYSGSAFRSNSVPCLMEFPPTCEVRVNGTQLTANLKGLKKKPGTAPPPDITKCTLFNASNKVELIYVNSQQPVPNKKYYMMVMLVEATIVDELVEQLKTSSYRKAEDIKRKMAESVNIDDDIIAGPSKMSLKCPLSFMRINTPCRSSKCVHSQCFDATSWYSMMEQTTTWLCPVCEKHLDYKELIIDGYFDEILKNVPENVEDVIVEADGEWHTADNTSGSPDWLAKNPPKLKQPETKKEVSPPPIKTEEDVGTVNGKHKSDVSYILLESSDDDDEEGQVKKELSPSHSANRSFDSLPGLTISQRKNQVSISSSQQKTQRKSDVIDLTLDSDEDEPVPVQLGKRKATDIELGTNSPTEAIWKKGRHEGDYHLPSISTLENPGQFRQHPLTNTSRLPPPPPGNSTSNRYPPYTGAAGPPPLYNGLPVRSSGSAPGSLQLPPLPGLSPPRSNSSGHWS